MIYFDHNATAPLHPESRSAWLRGCDELIGNPSSPHRAGLRAESALSEARQVIATHLGCDSQEIIWTSGATESSNLIFHHIARTGDSQSEVWISAIEHPATIVPADFYFRKSVRFIPVTSSGVVDLNWVSDALRANRPRLIVMMAVNNETGILQPWRRLAEICQEKEIPFFCDAVQWIGKLPANGLGKCDFVSGSAHKFGGPRGIGFLKVPTKGRFHPLVLGGKQQEGRRAGTENVPGAIAMAAILALREKAITRDEHLLRLVWRKEFERRLALISAETSVAGMNEDRLWNTSLAFLPDPQCRFRWVVKLDKAGFAVSTGSACASGEEEPSHVLTAMSCSPPQISRAIRFSSGWETSETDWTQLLSAIESITGQ